MELRLRIDGAAVPKARPRVVRSGKGYHAYTPQKTVDFENKVKDAFYKANGFMLTGAIEAIVRCYFTPPKSISKKSYGRIVEGIDMYTRKPDCDNLAKAILDSLNKIAYEDDGQIVKLTVEKHYSNIARTEVILTEVRCDLSSAENLNFK